MAGTDKYQVLTDLKGNHLIIERSVSESGKESWVVFVPDARDRNVASRLARLLNEEHERDQAKRANRTLSS